MLEGFALKKKINTEKKPSTLFPTFHFPWDNIIFQLEIINQ